MGAAYCELLWQKFPQTRAVWSVVRPEMIDWTRVVADVKNRRDVWRRSARKDKNLNRPGKKWNWEVEEEVHSIAGHYDYFLTTSLFKTFVFFGLSHSSLSNHYRFAPFANIHSCVHISNICREGLRKEVLAFLINYLPPYKGFSRCIRCMRCRQWNTSLSG